MSEETELLHRYAEDGDEGAFAAWVQAHLGLVYGAALRRLGGDAHGAADVAQQVFIAAARGAGRLARHGSVTGWLYAATRNAAINHMRDAQRRKQRERAADELARADGGGDGAADWERLKPVLDAAMDELGAVDREAVLLRFFEGRAFAEVGGRLAVSEQAARMRVERALEKLQARLARRGVTSTAAALGLVLAQQAGAATTAVPAGLAGSVTSAALAGAGSEAAGATGAFWGFMGTTKGVMAAGGAVAICTLLGTAGWQSAAARVAEAELAGLRAETATLAARREAAGRAAEAAEREATAWAEKVAAAEDARAKADAARRAAGARSVAAAPGAKTPNWDSVAEGRGLMERNPELARAVVARADAITNFTYGPLFRELGLSEAQQEAFRRAMREKGGISAPFGPQGEVYSFPAGTNPDQSGDEHLAQLRAIIGDEGLGRLAEFQRLSEARSAAAKVAGALAFSEVPLAGDQAVRLADLMMTTARTAGTNRINALNWEEIMVQAPTVLSGAQLEALAAVRAEETRRRASMRSVPMTTSGSGAGGPGK